MYFFNGFEDSLVGHCLKKKPSFEKQVFIRNQYMLVEAHIKCQTE
jgi:hypothetical protein